MATANPISLIGISGKIGSGKDTAAKLINYHCTGGAEEYTDIQGFLEFYDDGLDMYPWETKKFAGKLKQIVSLLTGISLQDLEKQEVKDSYLGPEWDRRVAVNGGAGGWNLADVGKYNVVRMKVRDLLQKVGTEALRDKIHEDIHINALFADFKDVWEDPDPVEDNDYTINSIIGDVNEEMCLITYNGGQSHAEVYRSEIKSPKWLIPDMRFPNEAGIVGVKGGITLRIDIPELDSQGQFYRGQTVYKLSKHPSETSLDGYPFHYRIVNDAGLEEFSAKIYTFLKHFDII